MIHSDHSSLPADPNPQHNRHVYAREAYLYHNPPKRKRTPTPKAPRVRKLGVSKPTRQA